MKKNLLFLLAFTTFSMGRAQWSPTSPTVIYGTDDRKEFYQIKNTTVRLQFNATGLMINDTEALIQDNSSLRLLPSTVEKTYHLCPNQVLGTQPALGHCSGILVAPNLYLTAGHCLYNEDECKTKLIVFDYKYSALSKYTESLSQKQYARCKRIIARSHPTSATSDDAPDLALIELEKPMLGRHYASLPKNKTKTNDRVYLIGYPNGMPAKFADNAVVSDKKFRYYFNANLDAFAGNSGSPVFSAKTHELIGILSSGEDDFTYNEAGVCNELKICPNKGGCTGEMFINLQSIKANLQKLISSNAQFL
jgi:V8-like Glu-specific endopeptidase